MGQHVVLFGHHAVLIVFAIDFDRLVHVQAGLEDIDSLLFRSVIHSGGVGQDGSFFTNLKGHGEIKGDIGAALGNLTLILRRAALECNSCRLSAAVHCTNIICPGLFLHGEVSAGTAHDADFVQQGDFGAFLRSNLRILLRVGGPGGISDLPDNLIQNTLRDKSVFHHNRLFRTGNARRYRGRGGVLIAAGLIFILVPGFHCDLVGHGTICGILIRVFVVVRDGEDVISIQRVRQSEGENSHRLAIHNPICHNRVTARGCHDAVLIMNFFLIHGDRAVDADGDILHISGQLGVGNPEVLQDALVSFTRFDGDGVVDRAVVPEFGVLPSVHAWNDFPPLGVEDHLCHQRVDRTTFGISRARTISSCIPPVENIALTRESKIFVAVRKDGVVATGENILTVNLVVHIRGTSASIGIVSNSHRVVGNISINMESLVFYLIRFVVWVNIRPLTTKPAVVYLIPDNGISVIQIVLYRCSVILRYNEVVLRLL